MKKWELARYLIEAKKNIDTLLYIKDNHQLLENIDLRSKIAATCQQFYINCCVVLDNSFPKAKKRLCENAIIASIYYERDKNSAHKDENYRSQKFKTLDELIAILKSQLDITHTVCIEYLPENITLDYVPHDKELFRLVYRVNVEMEYNIIEIKHPHSIFHSYQLSEEGQFYFRSLDTTEQDKRTAGIFGYDFDEVIKRQVLQSPDDIRELSEEEKTRQAVICENGLNSYEGLQNRQESCIKLNLLFGLDMWVTPNWQLFEMVDEFKTMGFMDQFEIVHWENVQDEESQMKLNAIFEKYNLKK